MSSVYTDYSFPSVLMMLNTTVIHCLANIAGYSNGDLDCSNFTLVVDYILGLSIPRDCILEQFISNLDRF